MTITGQNYDETTEIWPQKGLIVADLTGNRIEFDPEGAIKVAHALIEAAEEIIKK